MLCGLVCCVCMYNRLMWACKLLTLRLSMYVGACASSKPPDRLQSSTRKELHIPLAWL